jgi:hypothetical protein
LLPNLFTYSLFLIELVRILNTILPKHQKDSNQVLFPSLRLSFKQFTHDLTTVRLVPCITMKAPFPAPVVEWHNDTYPSIDPTRPELSVKGKKIIVTGGGSGIGRGTVEAFAQAGADSVAITGRRLEKLTETKDYIESKYKTKVTVHSADITDAPAMKKAASEIGGWDVLVMNAGYLSKPDSIQGSDVNEWWKAFEVCYILPFQKRSC